MSRDFFSVAAKAERNAGDVGAMAQHNLLQSTISPYDRCAGIAVPQRTTRERMGNCDEIVFSGELSGSFRDRVEADRMGAIRAGTFRQASRQASFGFTPYA
jgi:hypothetical protein